MTTFNSLQVVPSCHPGWENMESMENTENMVKMENINLMTENSIYGHRWKENYLRAWRTLSWVSSRWENIKRNVEPWRGHNTRTHICLSLLSLRSCSVWVWRSCSLGKRSVVLGSSFRHVHCWQTYLRSVCMFCIGAIGKHIRLDLRSWTTQRPVWSCPGITFQTRALLANMFT